MHWQRHKHGRAHAQAAGARIPVAVAIGTDPALTYAATAPLPPVLDEFAFAGLLRGKPVELVRAKSVDLVVPAHAEFVLEGYVDNEDLRVEGPFGDHTGVYSLADRYPTFHVTCITHRRNPIYAATVVGKPPMEDAWLGKATERIFLPILQAMLPEVVDMNLPVEGGFHNLALVSIRKSYPGQAKKVMNALWGLGHMMMLTRVLVVVDADVDVQDPRAVAWFVLNNLAPERDVVTMPGPVDDLDHGSYSVAYGTKIGIDATRKDASEGYTREWPPEMIVDEATRRLVSERWSAYGLDAAMKSLQPDDWSGQGSQAYDRLLRARGEPEPVKSAAVFLREIRVEHTLFALPFAYVGAILAARGIPSLAALIWITLAVLGARTAAMAANRFLDREIDARNPRTARRALASGTLAPATMLWASAAGLALLLISAWMLNPLCVKLMPIAALLVVIYPLCKRFTWTTHFVLGAVDGLAPLGAYVGVAGQDHAPGDLTLCAR